MCKRTLIFFCLLLNTFLVFPQKKAGKNPRLELANKELQRGNYLTALPIYKAEFKKDSTNIVTKYKLGICYLHTRINHEEALSILQECSLNPKMDPEIHMHLGRAFMLNNRLDEAIVCFTRYGDLLPKQKEDANHYIRQCKNAQALISLPASATFQNLGKTINSPEPDYLPLVNKDETILVFTSRRKENVGGKTVEMDGYRNSDIYYSEIKNGKWSQARNGGRLLNTALDEEAVGLSADGRVIFVYIDHIDKYGDLYVSRRNTGTIEFTKMTALEKVVNNKIETSACESEEGDILIFARRESINSTSDLYICRKLPTGKWSQAQKLPEHINSPYNEDSPFLSYDGETLYFASDGLNSMGGYDLFKCKWNRETNSFSNPENLGCPINSTDDERSISVTFDNSLGYISAFRPHGVGDLDIYRIKFNDDDPVSRVYSGTVFLGDSVQKNQSHHVPVSILASNLLSGMEYNFTPSSKTGKYVMTLPDGLYKIEVFAEGYQTFEEEMQVSDMGKMSIEYNKNILLKKLD
ncbi:MAG: PD40 domain-containing protein [Bacteroidia bacterium]|nr:PD40 domain-containing protein [Bacteroidia bacterium]